MASPADLDACRAAVQQVHVADAIAHYAVQVLRATRDHPRVRLGASTRGGVAMVALAKAFAVMAGRDFVAPADIARAAAHSLPHRLVLIGGDRDALGEATAITTECIATVQAPRR